jgi:Fur family peroxide stress response transcriptional regulator
MKDKNTITKGFKLTPQRLAILEYLNGNTTHPSADEIYKALQDKFPTMSFATIYNTLDTMKQQGNVAELTIDPHKKRFDPNPRPHHHLICITCKRIVDIPIDYYLNVPDEKKEGYEIVGNHIEFYGICKDCREKAA